MVIVGRLQAPRLGEHVATTSLPSNARGAAKGSFAVDVEGYVPFWVYTLGPGADDYAMTDYAYLP